MTTVADGLYQYGGMPVGSLPYTGNYYWVDPVHGNDGNSGRSPSQAIASLYRAQILMTAGNNDVALIISDGTTASTVRLSLANAVAANPNASPLPTNGTLVWAKNACHIFGVCAPTRVAQRARLAPPTGTYTAATFGANTFVSVTASDCHFENFSMFVGFSTGSATMIGWADTGSRNYYANVDFGGLADAASAGGSGARVLKIGPGDERTFKNCTFGLDTVTRTAANATIEFASGTARNTFDDCIFPFMTSAATPLALLATGNASMDRWHLFRRCAFLNNIKSTSTQMTVAASCTTASPGGMFMLQNCTSVGITKWGDTNALANMFVDGGAPTAATTGLAVAPT